MVTHYTLVPASPVATYAVPSSDIFTSYLLTVTVDFETPSEPTRCCKQLAISRILDFGTRSEPIRCRRQIAISYINRFHIFVCDLALINQF